MTGHWTDHAPRSLCDPLDPRGAPLSTALDRRWLWHLHDQLVDIPSDRVRGLVRDLGQYLGETCEHHWLDYTGPCCDPPKTDCLPPYWQCLWCHTVEWSS